MKVTPNPSARDWDAHCAVRYRLHGEVREWGFGCHATQDTPESIKAHLVRWMGEDAVFLSCRITRVKDGEVIHDVVSMEGAEQARSVASATERLISWEEAWAEQTKSWVRFGNTAGACLSAAEAIREVQPTASDPVQVADALQEWRSVPFVGRKETVDDVRLGGGIKRVLHVTLRDRVHAKFSQTDLEELGDAFEAVLRKKFDVTVELMEQEPS